MSTVGSSIENSWKNKMVAIATDCSETFHDCQTRGFKKRMQKARVVWDVEEPFEQRTQS